jgi:hypothetical protein
MSKVPSVPFELNEQQVQRLQAAISEDKKPEVLLFRILGPQLQQRFTDLVDLSSVPRLLLHGNPHLDNYARTYNGAGLLDFDRSRVGPSLWDISRALCSITFWSEGDDLRPKQEIVDCFVNSYMRAIEDRLVYWEAPDFLRKVKPKKFQLSTQKYLSSGKKWVKKLKKNLVDPEGEFYEGLFQAYLDTLPEGSLKHWTIKEVAEVAGSMGKKHYVYWLKPKLKSREAILLDIKETYSEVDNEHFSNPFEQEGERMVTASRIYSPGLEEGIGYCRYQTEDYWIRQIPTFSVKVPVGIIHDEAMQLAQEIGIQLGRGHRVIDEIYNQGLAKQDLMNAIESQKTTLIDTCEQLNQEVMSTYEYYHTQLKG